MPDFSQKSKFNKEANFESIKFGADAPLLETELNELQDIQNYKRRRLAKELFVDGIKDKRDIIVTGGTKRVTPPTYDENGVQLTPEVVTYDDIIVTIKDTTFVVDGDIIDTTSLTKAVKDGEKLYLEVITKEVKDGDVIKKYGNEQETSTVDNNIKDTRVGMETSRRNQVTYNLVTDNTNVNAKYLLIGEHIKGVFNIQVRNYGEVEDYSLPVSTHSNVISLPPDVTNGQINDIKIEGKTYRNILEDYFGKRDSWHALDGELIDNDFIKGTADGSNFKNFFLKSGLITLKSNTQYTIFVEVRKNTLTGGGLWVTSLHQGDPFNVTNIISSGRTGIFKFLVPTKENLSNTYPLRMFIDKTATSGEIEFRVMLLEGDYTNENISYIRGTKSTFGAIRLKSVGKNIWGGRKAVDDIVQIINDSNYAYLTNIDGRNCLALVGHDLLRNKDIFNKFKPNTQYTIQVYAKTENSSYNGGYLLIEYTDGSAFGVYPTSDVWSKSIYISIPEKTIKSIQLNYGYVGHTTYFDYDTLQIEEGTQATEYEPYKESTMYVVGRDEKGNILELRSLLNGVKDEIRVSEGKLIKNISNEIIFNGNSSETWGFSGVSENGYARFYLSLANYPAYFRQQNLLNFRAKIDNHHFENVGQVAFATNLDNGNKISLRHSDNFVLVSINSTLLSEVSINGFKAFLSSNPLTLFYQLAEPIEVPIQVTGNLKVYKNGSIYVDFIMPRKDNYGEDGINVGIPIKEIVSLYKVEKESGVERELNISNVEFSSDKTSFIHPDLEYGDLVKWEFVPDIETTTPITAIKYPTNLKGQIESNSNAIQKISKDIDILDAKIIGNTQSIKDLSNKVGHNKQGIEELFTQVDSNKAEIESLDVRVTDNRNTIDQIGVIAVENQNMLADIVPQVNANRDNIEILEVEVNSVKSSVDGLNNRVTETEQDIGSVQSEINSLNQHKEQLNNYLRVDSNGNFIIGTQDNPSNIRVSDEGVTVTTNRLYIGNFVIEKYNDDILIVRPIE